MSAHDEETKAMALFMAARRYSTRGAIEDAREVAELIGKADLSDDAKREWAVTVWTAFVESGAAAEFAALVEPERPAVH